jgi:hypothetical protein
MALKSDSQGFLIGEPVDIGKAVDQLRRIRNDVADIKRSMLSAPNSGSNGSKNTAIDQSAKIATPSSPRNRDSKPPAKAATPVRSNSGAVMPSIASAASTGTVTPNGRAKAAMVATPKGRDSAGQFIGKIKPTNDAAREKTTGRFTSNGGDDERRTKGVLNNFVDRIATTAIGATAGAEQSDPTIKAFQEVAEPMQRGYQSLFGGDEKDNKERWYKKIFKELNLFRKDETAFNKAQNKVLKNIEEKSGGHSVSSSGGGLSKMIGMIPGVGLLGGLGKGLLKGGKGLFRKIPFLGALLSGAGAASDIYDTEGDDSITRLEKDRRNGKTAGGLAGSLGGMMAGAALGSVLGPVGTVVGGAVGMFLGDQGGQIIGEKLGEWTNELRNADIPGKIIGAWNTTTDAIKSGWDGALKLMSSAWDKTKEAADAANEFVKEKTGVDVKSEVKSAHKKAVEYTSDNIIAPGVEAAKKGAEWVGKNTTVGKGAKALWNEAKGFLAAGAETAGIDPKIVAKIANFESGFNSNAAPVRKDGTRISSAHGYGQFIDGTWTEMVNKYGSKYGIADAGKLTKQQAAKYRDDKGIQAGMLAEFTRENIEKGRKYGGTNDDANVYAFHNLGDKDAKNLLSGMKQNPDMSVRAALLQGVSSEKEQARIEKVIAGNKSLYGDGNISATDAYNRMGSVMRRGEVFAADMSSNNPTPVNDEQGKPKLAKVASIKASNMPLYDSLGVGIGSASQAQTAFAAAPKVPTFTPAPVPAEAPPQVLPLASLDSGRNVTVTMPNADVGRDVSDRGIAHIVTGGLSGKG